MKKKSNEWENCKSYFGFCCAYCGRRTDLTKDHVRPQHYGGSDVVFNIIPCCQKCNSSKGKKNVYQWYFKQKFFSYQRLIRINMYIYEKIISYNYGR